MQTPHLLMHSSVGHLDCFYFLPIMNNSAKNIHVSVFVWTYIFHCLTYLGMELLGHMVTNYPCLSNYPSAFHSTYTAVHSHWQAPVSLHPHQHLLFSIFWTAANLLGVKYYLIVVSICISLMTKDVKHLFRGILAICVSFLKKCLFTSLGAKLLHSCLTL